MVGGLGCWVLGFGVLGSGLWVSKPRAKGLGPLLLSEVKVAGTWLGRHSKGIPGTQGSGL